MCGVCTCMVFVYVRGECECVCCICACVLVWCVSVRTRVLARALGLSTHNGSAPSAISFWMLRKASTHTGITARSGCGFKLRKQFRVLKASFGKRCLGRGVRRCRG